MMSNLDKDIEIVKNYLKDSAINKDYGDFFKTGGWEVVNLEIPKAMKNVLSKLVTYKHLYEELSKDFEDYKNNKDINYLDGIHHKKLVEKSIGQIIDDPKECWFDVVEVKVIKNNMLCGITTDEDFINLKQISDTDTESCITVIAESPLSGAIYRYNNYGNKEWQLIGTMLGYA